MKVLADTSIWIEHLRYRIREFEILLENDDIGVHPFVIGELACGTLPRRTAFLREIENLPKAGTVSQGEALAFLGIHNLSGSGLGWVDIHLLASAFIAGAKVWTRDKALHKAAEKLRIAFYS